jgi:hypothetical protein
MKTTDEPDGYLVRALQRLRAAGKFPEPAVLAKKLGYKSEISLKQRFDGPWQPPLEIICKLAEIMDIEPSWLVLLWLADLCPLYVPLFRKMAQGLMHDPEKVRSLFADVGESAPPFWS